MDRLARYFAGWVTRETKGRLAVGGARRKALSTVKQSSGYACRSLRGALSDGGSTPPASSKNGPLRGPFFLEAGGVAARMSPRAERAPTFAASTPPLCIRALLNGARFVAAGGSRGAYVSARGARSDFRGVDSPALHSRVVERGPFCCSRRESRRVCLRARSALRLSRRRLPRFAFARC
jgi:hypothetical protein